eukprot:jgi/Botrbrau1/1090/Bobra.0076s0054.1
MSFQRNGATGVPIPCSCSSKGTLHAAALPIPCSCSSKGCLKKIRDHRGHVDNFPDVVLSSRVVSLSWVSTVALSACKAIATLRAVT